MFDKTKTERRAIPIPEGPELKHSRDRLRQTLIGKTITSMYATDEGRFKKKLPENLEKILQNLPLVVEAVDTKGKFMWWTLSSGTAKWYMWCTYGMSGQWLLEKKKHAAFVVELKSKDAVYFVDPRRFGTIKFTSSASDHEKKLKSLGPDILDDSPFDVEIFVKNLVNKPGRTISEALMDQSCVSGVGNYLKSEILYRAGISPHRIVSDITSSEYLRLYEETLLTSEESYADHGASIRTYKTVENTTGRGQFNFKVYGKKFCQKNHIVQREITLDGRTSWWCKDCQK